MPLSDETIKEEIRDMSIDECRFIALKTLIHLKNKSITLEEALSFLTDIRDKVNFEIKNFNVKNYPKKEQNYRDMDFLTWHDDLEMLETTIKDPFNAIEEFLL